MYSISTYVRMYFMYSIMCYELELYDKRPFCVCVLGQDTEYLLVSVSSPVKCDNTVPTR